MIFVVCQAVIVLGSKGRVDRKVCIYVIISSDVNRA